MRDETPRPLPPRVCGRCCENVGRDGQKQSAARRLRARPICNKIRFQQD
ncbi:hypothetical protein HMPREF0972_00877 [Actinomyces sp. oral taxon 848 str. F0332]|nr:hypothetical protein HMPREF0972_00877 [Actinomyces sp. oral taxon 848 str. F0332]